MSLLLVAATTHKANPIPVLMIGIGFILLGPMIRLRDRARQQRAARIGDSSGQKVKWLEQAVIGYSLLLAAGIIWMVVEVESIH